MKFAEYLSKKTRESRKQLNIVHKILEQKGLKVKDFLDDDYPYIYLKAANESDLSFGGVRIYKAGNTLAYRVQKDSDKEPYGKAYQLDIEEMFNELLSDSKMNEEKAGKTIIEALLGEFNRFFTKSAEAEKELRELEYQNSKDQSNLAVVGYGSSDYANSLYKTNL